MTSAEADTYYARFRKRVVETNDDFSILEATFTTQNPNFPPKAWVKVFHSVTPEMYKEQGMLMKIMQDLPANNVVKYLHYIINKGKLYLFLEFCSKTLEKEIAQRKRTMRRWGEGEILKYMREMLETLRLLHSNRIVHRNINPSTIFIHENQLKLGHFEDAKEIHRGLTQRFSTLKGYENYFSPQISQAYRTKSSGVTYEMTYRDDIWALGRVFYDLATLKSNEEIATWLDEGQRGFATCLERELRRIGFSMRFVNIIQKMLTLDSATRPEAETLLNLVNGAMAGLPRCHKCEDPVGQVLKVCEHDFCERCIASMIQEAMGKNETVDSLICNECGVIYAQVETAVQRASLITLTEKIKLLKKNQILKCDFCPEKHLRLNFENGTAKAYFVKCACNHNYCSYCHHEGGHGFLGLFSRCPDFQ